MMKMNFYQPKTGVWKALAAGVLMLFGTLSQAQTLPYQFFNNSQYADDQIYVAIVGIQNGAHMWVDPANGQVHPMSSSYNTVPGPVINGNMGPGGNAMYADCFRRLSEIPNNMVNIPRLNGGKMLISFESQLYLYFFGSTGSPSGYSAPDLNNPTDPNQGIKFENIEFTYDQYGLWINTTRVDSYQYPMGLEVWGSGFYKKVGELKTHQEILNEWQATAPSEFQGLLSNGMIHFPTKSSSFDESLIQSYIDQIWSKYSSQQLVFNSGDAGVWRGSISGNNFVFTRDGDGQVGTIPGKPTVEMAMEASGVMATGSEADKIVQKMLAAAINRHALDLNLGSGAMQDFGNPANYYQTWPYNWYAKFWHRTDISHEGFTYAFSFDDVFDQSATVHTPNPNNIKITIGGFAGTGTSGVVTLYEHCNYGGYSASLNVGSYTLNQLQVLGIANDDISSIRVQSGYEITLYQHHDFTGNTLVKSADDGCLVDDNFNDSTSSVVVSQTSSGWSTHIEAENWAVQSGVQTEPCSEGGQNVGWIEANDWIVWDVNLPSSGTYTVEYRVASLNGGGTLQLENAGGSPVYGTRTVPSTGGWQNWTTISHNVNLTGGQQQIAIKALAGGWNINWLKISSTGGARIGEAETTPAQVAVISVYPNPVKDLLKISVPDNVPVQSLLIYDLTGKLVLSRKVDDPQQHPEFNVAGLKPGNYLLKVKTLSGVHTSRIIKE